LLVTGGIVWIFLPPYGLLIAMLGLLLFRVLGTRVMVSDAGVRVASWPIPRPRRDIALAQVAAAHVVQATKSSAGDRHIAGLDVDLAVLAVLVRDGDHLVITLDNGSYVAVSVDGAHEAADVINALVARERARTTLASDARHP
jgi:hypothetical protein